MSETPENKNEADSAAAPDSSNAPSMAIMAQYLKDLSFENPRAPASIQGDTAPTIDVNVDVQARGLNPDQRALNPDQYEVELSVAARATRGDDPVFVVEATYAGVFQLKNLPREQLEMAMLVECPRLLFPFMRQIIADATRNGNFPPLMLEPIDFMGIYLNNAENARQQQQAEQAPA